MRSDGAVPVLLNTGAKSTNVQEFLELATVSSSGATSRSTGHVEPGRSERVARFVAAARG